MSQRDTIRTHLSMGHTITAMQALRDYGVGRLAARIDELRREGMDIATDMIDANGKRFARYRVTE